jgi:hypothetical protein
VPEKLIRFDYGSGSRGASSVISRLGGYADGLVFVVPYVWWQKRGGTGRNVDILSSMPRYIVVLDSIFIILYFLIPVYPL